MNILQKISATWDFLMIGKVNLYGGNPFPQTGTLWYQITKHNLCYD